MRKPVLVGWGLLLLGVLLLVAGLAAKTTIFEAPAAALVLAAAGIWIATRPSLRKAFPPLPPMPDLNLRPNASQRWCADCGRPAPRNGSCAACGNESPGARRKLRRLQRKQRARPQERKA